MKIGRNDLCLCGSGKKYKKCCLALESGRVVPEGMQDLMADIRQKIEGDEFGSLEEVNLELDKMMANIFVKAFPQLLGEIVETPYCIPEERLALVYCHRTFNYFATFLGFISYHSISDSLIDQKYEVKKLPLLDQFLSFNV